MRTLRLAAAAVALAQTSCFQIEPLPTCQETDGLFAPYYVCMPRSEVSIALDAAPRQLVAGNFDSPEPEAVRDDLAVLIDEAQVRVFSSTGLKAEPPAPDAAFVAGDTRVEVITAARFYDRAGAAEDIFTVLEAGGAINPARVIGWPNQGPLLFSQDDADPRPVGTTVTCPTPSGVNAIYEPGAPVAGVFTDTVTGYLYQKSGGTLAAQPLPLLTKFAQVRAGAVAPLDGLGLDDLVFSFLAAPADGGEAVDDHLGVLLVGATPQEVDPDTTLVVPLAAGAVSLVIAEDLDEDGDVDLLAVHPDSGVVSIVRQKRSDPLTFEAPEPVPFGAYIFDVIVGDFSADGRPDLAIAHTYEDTGISVISFLIRQPDALPGSTAYGFAPATFGLGEITDLESIDFDGDGRLDIAAAFKTGSTGSVEIYLNRSPAGA